jgi:hypothetical protein
MNEIGTCPSRAAIMAEAGLWHKLFRQLMKVHPELSEESLAQVVATILRTYS